ncbi:uncharacterized protein [Chelonus insularis]|uniref:uncharacterized protein n=1 Tax=Chelonus insularis TaxID=460826 RepID=UPI00158DD610|nr:uncharacterized protein LOC118065787 [Chelonus insularis]
MAESKLSVEFEDVPRAVRFSKLYSGDHLQIDRNPQLTHIVHATLHFFQFATITTIEVFHHVHHAIHKQSMKRDPTLPSLDPERNTLLIINLPFNVAISLTLCFIWCLAKNFHRKLDFSLVGCSIQSILSFANAIVIMRQARIHINEAGVHREDVIEHPIFIHCFVICMLSIFGFSLNQTQFWLLYDCLEWRKKQEKNQDTSVNKSHSSQDTQYQMTDSRISDDQLKLDHMLRLDRSSKIEDDPVNLYCCCVDYWNYFRLRGRRSEINHEFQVVYIM